MQGCMWGERLCISYKIPFIIRESADEFNFSFPALKGTSGRSQSEAAEL